MYSQKFIEMLQEKVNGKEVTLDSNLKFVSLRYDESYGVSYYGVPANCTGFVSYNFSY